MQPKAATTFTAKKQVAVVVPMSNRAKLSPDEVISLRHLVTYLGNYDSYLIVPETLDIQIPGFYLARFDNNYFGSAAANTRLMLSRGFYERFSDYEYILVYHLDALVFADELEAWCEAGYDYIGPPWLISKDTPWVKEESVGNGGFCLRRVSSCLRVLDSKRYAVEPDEYWRRLKARYPGKLMQLLNWPRTLLQRLHAFNNIQREIRNFRSNEDKFWSFRAQHYDPQFKLAPVEEALRFGFESDPALNYERIGGRLPFGCHAWPKFGRSFWENYLLQPVEESP